MSLMRRAVLGVADIPAVHRFFENNRYARKLVDRFVAGDTLDEALAISKDFATRGITVTLDLLGENVATVEEATAAVSVYVDILHQMKANDLEPNISVKLTMLGLDLGDEVARGNMQRILEAAREVGGFVRIDMEGSDYTERTMNLFASLHDEFPDEVGIVIQTYLHRAADDVVDSINRKARVRLVKGAYAEPESVAMGPKENDENFGRLMRHLLDKGRFPAIATHDPALIEATIRYARENGISPDRFEFQMLYGVRRSEQERLRKEGWNMRVYVAYGTQWYPYFTRRIAERPSNAFFVARQLLER